MRHLSVYVEVDAPAADVWALLAEYRHWPSWGTTVRAVEASDAEVAPGAKGRVRTPVGIWLPFEITAVEPGRSWHWRVGGVPATGHFVEDVGPSRSRVVITVPWLAAPYLVLVRPALRRLEVMAKQRS